MKSDELIGKEVVGSGGWKIGNVKDVNFDQQTWRIGSLVVNLDRDVAKEFEMQKLVFKSTIHLDVDSVKSIGDHVMLSTTKSDVQKLASQQKQ